MDDVNEEPTASNVFEPEEVFRPGTDKPKRRYTLTHEEVMFLNEQRDRINKYGTGGQT